MKSERAQIKEVVITFLAKHIRNCNARYAACEATSIAFVLLGRIVRDMKTAFFESVANRLRESREMILGIAPVE